MVTALLDSCVLYPAPLRDLLMRLAMAELFHGKWSAAIHEEWMRNLLANRRDLSLVQVERTRRLMDTSVLDCVVEGFEPLIPSLSLPDLDDRHVLAAAIHTDADIIVTMNLRDFPSAALAPYGIEAQHPDGFCLSLAEQMPERVREAVQEQWQALRHPPKSRDEFLATLEAQGLARFVARLRELL